MPLGEHWRPYVGLAQAFRAPNLSDVSRLSSARTDEIEVPSAVKDLIEGRLRGLEHDQRRILDAGSVIGMTFDPDLVSASATCYQRMLGDLCLGFMWLMMATAAGKGSGQGKALDKARITCARTFFERTLAGIPEHARIIKLSSRGLMDIDAELIG